jgi:hypothetical protein
VRKDVLGDHDDAAVAATAISPTRAVFTLAATATAAPPLPELSYPCSLPPQAAATAVGTCARATRASGPIGGRKDQPIRAGFASRIETVTAEDRCSSASP